MLLPWPGSYFLSWYSKGLYGLPEAKMTFPFVLDVAKIQYVENVREEQLLTIELHPKNLVRRAIWDSIAGR